MKTLRNSKGFTLIELIIIIIILGILSAVAVPKYINMKEEAEKGVAAGVVGALNGAEQMLFAKNLLDSTATYNSTSVISNVVASGVSITGTVITLDNGSTYTVSYTAGDTTKPGLWSKGW